jgi:hypothetical protein
MTKHRPVRVPMMKGVVRSKDGKVVNQTPEDVKRIEAEREAAKKQAEE